MVSPLNLQLNAAAGGLSNLFNGYLLGNRIGNNQEEPSGNNLNLLGRPSTTGNSQGLTGLLQRYAELTANKDSIKNIQKEEEEKEDEKEDTVELSDFAKQAVEQAVEQAESGGLVNGTTQQVFVSEDGRYEASIDLRLNGDGSFDLDISVGMAQSRTAGIGSQQSSGNGEVAGSGNAYSSSASMMSRTTVEYERMIAQDDWQAQIYYSSVQQAAVGISQSYGEDMGNQVMQVGAQLSKEFQMNISVSGADLDSFLAQVEQIASSEEDSGDLGGFLTAVSNVLTASPENLSDLFGATNALINQVGEQVSNALDDFFTSIGETFGSQLEEMGLGTEFLDGLKEESQSGLTQFLDVTNSFFQNILGVNSLEDTQTNSELQLLQESLEMQQEAMEEEAEQTEEETESTAGASNGMDFFGFGRIPKGMDLFA
ncbi:MAG TPA: hypothetical protein PLG59_16900 [bacterium]|nr:hypothetical protein [bacterium]HQO36346.1 hypothetical protein [bacterium]HQP98123.1 hypothetical protein [bacterium]